MSPNPPQTLSVKRKRTEAPVDALIIEHDGKRLKSDTFTWRLQHRPDAQVHPPLLSPTTHENRRFFLDSGAGVRNGRKHVLVETRPTAEGYEATRGSMLDGQAVQATTRDSGPTVQETPRPRKRPGAGTALHVKKDVVAVEKPSSVEVSDRDVRKFEEFAESIEKEESAPRHVASPLKVKPKAPALRFKDRHPEQAAALAAQDPDAMDVDSDEYVYDTYVREIIIPDAEGKIPEPQGTVGFIVINEEDVEWWNGDDESDREFDTDDEDENAEDYYANDYPEDELDSDDEYDRDLYQPKYRHGSDDEEFDLDNEDDDIRSDEDEDEDDKHFRMTAPKSRPGYWGRFGE